MLASSNINGFNFRIKSVVLKVDDNQGDLLQQFLNRHANQVGKRSGPDSIRFQSEFIARDGLHGWSWQTIPLGDSSHREAVTSALNSCWHLEAGWSVQYDVDRPELFWSPSNLCLPMEQRLSNAAVPQK